MFQKVFIIIFTLCIFLTTQIFSLQIDPQGELRFALGGEVSLLNPVLSTDTVSSAVEGVLFSGLVTVNEKLEMVPDLAKSWQVSKDGKIWTFYLRRNVKWHDGVPFSSADVKFTFDTILNPKVNSVRRSDYIIAGQPIKFLAVDKYTFRAILPQPFAPFLIHMGMGILPKHLLAGKDLNTADFNRRPVGTGPFKFLEWKTGDHITVVANANYYLGKPLLKSINYKIIPDENARLIAFEAGEIDAVDVPAKDYARMKAGEGALIVENDVLMYTYLGFNLANPKFGDRRVRQAIAQAINKQQIIGLVLRGLGLPANVPSAPASWAYAPGKKLVFDPVRARQLLNEAGVEELEFTVLVNQGNKEREKAAVIIQQQLKKVGIKMNIRVLEWSAMLKIVNAPKDPRDFEAVLMGWSLGLDPDAYSIWHSSQYPRGFNFIKYTNKQVDKWLEQGRTTVDRRARKKIYAQIWTTLAWDQPYVYLWYPKGVSAISHRVGGLAKPNPAGVFLHIEKVYIKK
ncbi:hypothetical protein A2311_03840 [candidate division WOR-1 bacterium RIFOXYB2_FULL_48_7]|uniref:Solute-binding protein family 5 domain-containing protein n=1 Tax=candidate division WOR-1 bacterium RIFOXYB2_FULL_48_7 TaxID=1802583 RepID=A0A1F4T8N9_UNCSA|nr:MAG: hypothetical protein A2311_03840 [candidate division WOR-1 bacterium RIFOXYB2_FULL_48_7]